MVDGESREARSIGNPTLERRMIRPPFRKCFHHSVIGFLWRSPCLVIHNMHETPWLILQQPHTLRIIEVRYLWYESRDPFRCVLVHMALKESTLNTVLQPLIREIHAELVEGI